MCTQESPQIVSWSEKIFFFRRRDVTIKHFISEQLFKKPNHGYAEGSTEYFYEKLLTTKGFEIVNRQFILRKPMDFVSINKGTKTCLIQSGFCVLRTETDICECTTYTSNLLPCRHIFAVREYFNLPLYDAALCCNRWYKLHNIFNQPALLENPPLATNPPEALNYPFHVVPSKKAQTIPQKKKLMQEVLGNILYAGIYTSSDIFENRIEQLQVIESAWRQNKEIKVLVDDAIPNLESLAISEVNDNVEGDYIESIEMPYPLKLRGRPRNYSKCHT